MSINDVIRTDTRKYKMITKDVPTTKDILIKAREIISDEKNWTQKAQARDKDGHEVSYLRPWAVCFCSVGAVERASIGHPRRALAALDFLSGEICSNIAEFNDTSSHAEVLAMFDKAIANAS
jgi:hypothetical protein